MSKRSITYLISAVLSLWLGMSSTALAAVSSTPQSAASSGIGYLAANQQADGSIAGSGLGESEWTAVAVEAGGQNIATFSHGGSSLLTFLEGDVPTAATPAGTLERKIIAIAAAGQNPASFGGVDYEALLGAQLQSGQIGDPTLLNDDIFGIIAIDAAHATALKPEAQDALDYLLANQSAGGGFSYTTDTCAWCGPDSSDTASAIVAMYAASDLGLGSSGMDAARSQALTYLLGTQQADGGFGSDALSPSDGSSTSWALMALNATGSSVASSAASARDWLLDDQNADGGFSYGAYGITNSDTYTTSSAVLALLGTTWLLNPTPLAVTTPPTAPAATPKSTKPAVTEPVSTTSSAVTTTTAPDQTSNAAEPATTSSGTTSKPQVKGASTVVHHGSAPTKINNVKRTDHRSAIYGAAVLALVAALWFVLESRKGPSEANERQP